MKKRLILILSLYFLIVFLVFTYLLFPLDSLKNKIEHLFSENFSSQLLINKISFGFPPHLLMKKLQVVLKDQDKSQGQDIMYIDEIKITPNPLWIFTGKLWIHTNVSVANGNVNVQIGRKIIGSPRSFITCDLDNLSLQEFAFLKRQIGLHVTGALWAEADFNFLGPDIIKSEGTWSFKIEKGRIIPPHFPSFSFDSILGRGFIQAEKIHLEDIKLEGEELFLQAKGEVRIARDIKDFYVDTKVRLKLFPKFEKRFGFISNLLPKPDTEGYINVPIYGPPHALKFSIR